MSTKRNFSIAFVCGLMICAAGVTPSHAQQEDVAAFYAGKQVRLIVGIGVGSGYDTTARLVGRHIGKHIPGKPDVIVSNQPGAGSATMSNALYATGARDGTVIGAPFNGMPTMPLLQPESVRFDPTKLGWVGSANRAYQATYVWHTAPIKSMQDVLKETFVVGSQAPGSSQHDYPAVSNVLFGTKFKIINGYEATPKIHLAMERGEVMGSAATSYSTVKATTGDWIKEKKISVIAQYAMKKHPELPDVPLWLDLAKTEQQKLAMRLLLVRLEWGVPYFTPPEVPAARLTALRRAFDATMNDPGYRAESERAKLEVDPMTGEEIQKLVAETMATPPAVVKLVRDAMAAQQ
jgi:tripartite-type tricarboxylate transporter receptor subunit TctC